VLLKTAKLFSVFGISPNNYRNTVIIGLPKSRLAGVGLMKLIGLTRFKRQTYFLMSRTNLGLICSDYSIQ
jgi:hypothetical protein